MMRPKALYLASRSQWQFFMVITGTLNLQSPIGCLSHSYRSIIINSDIQGVPQSLISTTSHNEEKK